MDNIPAALINQVPDLVALIIIVFVFVRYLEKRDQQYTALFTKLSADIQMLAEQFKVHDAHQDRAVEEMHRVVAREARLNDAIRKQVADAGE
jgi:predicted Holliday junction resolvase-like endonuclease